jgi:hypothetical protein
MVDVVSSSTYENRRTLNEDQYWECQYLILVVYDWFCRTHFFFFIVDAIIQYVSGGLKERAAKVVRTGCFESSDVNSSSIQSKAGSFVTLGLSLPRGAVLETEEPVAPFSTVAPFCW